MTAQFFGDVGKVFEAWCERDLSRMNRVAVDSRSNKAVCVVQPLGPAPIINKSVS